MAVQLEFINFIAPIETINEKYPGGWEQRLKDHQNLIGGRVWFDDYLFRDGAMNPMDIGSLVGSALISRIHHQECYNRPCFSLVG